MSFLTFFGSVWVSVIIGLFLLAMTIGCSYDRSGQEEPKWVVFFIGLVAFGIWQYSNIGVIWNEIVNGKFWTYLGIYLGIGLGYSILEFTLAVRRASRKWKDIWDNYNARSSKTLRTSEVIEEFFKNHVNYDNNRALIGVQATGDRLAIEPKVNRKQLAESIGCWTVWWPFYAISLIVGDLLAEVFRTIADMIANLSTGLVKLAFKDTFKF